MVLKTNENFHKRCEIEKLWKLNTLKDDYEFSINGENAQGFCRNEVRR